MVLNSKERKFLKSKAHHFEPVVVIGQNGITQNLIKETDLQLAQHELIKVRFQAHKEERRQYSSDLANNTASEFVGLVGNIAILYRQHAEKAKRKYKLPKNKFEELLFEE